MTDPIKAEEFIDFAGRRVVVSGASSGIGRAIAIELSRRGASLILAGRDHSRLEETAGLLATEGAYLMVLDFRRVAMIQGTVKEALASCGPVYGFCHCAGVVETLPLSAITPAGLQALFEVNVVAGLEMAKTLSRRDSMTAEGGSILFVTSIYASVGMPGQIGYSASKGALIAASRTMAVELARRKIRVNTISPGLVHTRLSDTALNRLDAEKTKKLEEAHPLGVGTPEDVAHAAVFLLAPQTRWLTGTDLIIDGGYTAQ